MRLPTDTYRTKYFDKGSLLTPGVPLYTIVDNSRLELECVVPSYQLSSIRVGQSATFQTPTWASVRFEGTVSAINPEIESDSRSVKVKLKIANLRGELRTGMYAEGAIVTGRDPQAILIPRDSLIPEKEGSEIATVFIVKEGKAIREKHKGRREPAGFGAGPAGPSGRRPGDHRDRAVSKRRNGGSGRPVIASDTFYRYVGPGFSPDAGELLNFPAAGLRPDPQDFARNG